MSAHNSKSFQERISIRYMRKKDLNQIVQNLNVNAPTLAVNNTNILMSFDKNPMGFF